MHYVLGEGRGASVKSQSLCVRTEHPLLVIKDANVGTRGPGGGVREEEGERV